MGRAVRFTFRVTLPASDAPTSVWLPRPVEDAWQRVLDEARPEGLELRTSSDAETGTSMLHGTLPAAAEPTTFEVGFTVERAERHHATPSPAPYPESLAARLAPFLRSDRRVRADGANLERARAIASADEPPVMIARKIFDHVRTTLAYDARGCTPDRSHELGDLDVACELGSGTCTEFHGLFVAFARALGVGARFNFGFNIPRGKREGAIAGYHCWAEIVLADGSWFPVDVSEARKRPELADFYFGSLDADRVAFTYGRDVQLVPPQHGPRLDRFIFPYAETDGVVVDPVLAFTFRDV